VQEHHARALHWDFRLEVGGVLASWAVPKGPSLNPADKRMAIRTEDHPLAYANFEGVIPEGEYGAGRVILWDRGTYRNLTERDGEEVPMEKALDGGHASFSLGGRKLGGAFALTRIVQGKRERWLLVKKADEKADRRRNPMKGKPRAVISAAHGRAARSSSPLDRLGPELGRRLRRRRFPTWSAPMLATLTDEQFSAQAGSSSTSSTVSACLRSAMETPCGFYHATASHVRTRIRSRGSSRAAARGFRGRRRDGRIRRRRVQLREAPAPHAAA
jgi:DNA ligase D-like protein (predicted 3'-phosphoesterase)